jgi:cytosine/adenosine deaminase-related metal-dependent hydrolase
VIADGAGTLAAPGVLLLEGHRIIASGTPASIGEVARAAVHELQTCVVIPALVNAHAHLDLTHVGLQPFSGSFAHWAGMVRDARLRDERCIHDSVSRGVELARRGGTALIGDISGDRNTTPLDALRASGMQGVSFVEIFGAGASQPRAIERMLQLAGSRPPEESGVKLGLQPHAPYSCGIDVYRAAAATGLPLATHLAETLEELQFVRAGDGPIADMLHSIGVLDESCAPAGLHPIDLLSEVLAQTPCVAAHLNYLNEAHLAQMARWPITVAYCPRASAYFGHPHQGRPPHAYRQMLHAGINVALGTDSIICLDTPDRLSVLDDMRLLWQRDGTELDTLLRMATVNGAVALGADPDAFTLHPGPCMGLLALESNARQRTTASDLVAQVMRSSLPPRWVLSPQREPEPQSAPA